MNKQSEGHVVITGASRGIGLAIAERFALSGYRLSLIARDRDRLSTAAAKLRSTPGGASVAPFPADIADEEAVNEAFRTARGKHGAIDILINNAGVAESSPFHRLTLDQWNTIIGINLTGTYLCSRGVIEEMIARKYGRIVNVASTAGLVGYSYVSAYCAAKHGIIGLTRSLAKEVAKHNITINCVCPGFTETEILQQTIENSSAKTGRSTVDVKRELLATNPRGRFVTPSEVASCVHWLCQNEQSAINGAAIPICAGEIS